MNLTCKYRRNLISTTEGAWWLCRSGHAGAFISSTFNSVATANVSRHAARAYRSHNVSMAVKDLIIVVSLMPALFTTFAEPALDITAGKPEKTIYLRKGPFIVHKTDSLIMELIMAGITIFILAARNYVVVNRD